MTFDMNPFAFPQKGGFEQRPGTPTREPQTGLHLLCVLRNFVSTNCLPVLVREKKNKINEIFLLLSIKSLTVGSVSRNPITEANYNFFLLKIIKLEIQIRNGDETT